MNIRKTTKHFHMGVSMRRFSALALSVVLLLAASADLFARGSSSFSRSSSPSRSSFSSSSSRSSGSSSFSGGSRKSSTTFSKPAPASTVSKPAPAPTYVKPAKTGAAVAAGAVAGTAVVATSSNPPAKATATSATSQAMAKQNAIGAKTYTSRTQAESDFKAQQASMYTNSFKTQPTTRPEYIPGSISRGGTTYNVTYHNGGYGYYDHGRWSPLDLAVYMVVTDAMLDHNGYGYNAQTAALQQQNALLAQQNAQLAQQNQELDGTAVAATQPVVTQPSVAHHGPSAAVVFVWIIVGGCILAIIIFIVVKMFA